MKKITKVLALLLSLAIAFSLAGCMTTTTTKVVSGDDVSTSGGKTSKGTTSKDGKSDSADNNDGDGDNNNGGSNNNGGGTDSLKPGSVVSRNPGKGTLNFEPVADKGANYNVKGTVTIAVDTARATDYAAMFDVMEKLYPNVTIKYDYWSHNKSDSSLEYLTTRASTGKMADIIFDDAGTVPTYVMNGWVYPITKYVDADAEKSNLPDNLRKDYTYCGELYALPNSAHFNVEVFNTDLLNKLGLKAPGMTWNMTDYEKYLRAAAAKFTQKLCVGVANLGDAYNTYGYWYAMENGSNCGQWGYNYSTQQVDPTYLVEGAKKMRYWRTMTGGVEAWYESTQKGSNGVSQLESNLGLTNPDTAFTAGKALLMDWNTAGTNKTSLKYKFNYTVVPTPNSNGKLPIHVDCSFITTACKDENIEAAYQLLRFMTISTNGNLARLQMYEASEKGKYALNSRIYYPTTNSQAVHDKFNKLAVATETDKYLVANVKNSIRYDDTKLVPNLADSFYKDAAPAFNEVRDGKDDGSGLTEAVKKWNKTIKSNLDSMNSEIKKAQAEFKKTHK